MERTRTWGGQDCWTPASAPDSGSDLLRTPWRMSFASSVLVGRARTQRELPISLPITIPSAPLYSSRGATSLGTD